MKLRATVYVSDADGVPRERRVIEVDAPNIQHFRICVDNHLRAGDWFGGDVVPVYTSDVIEFGPIREPWRSAR